MKQAILFLSEKSDFCITEKFSHLSGTYRSDENDIIFLYHQKEKLVPDTIKEFPHYIFTSNIKKIPKLIFPSSETPSSPTSTISEYLHAGFTLLALLS